VLGVRGRVLAASLLALTALVIEGSGAWAQTASGPSADPLAPARALFADALRDEDAQRFSDALQKFVRVRAVRDTASIEYRIGACYEGLGQPLPAFAAYKQATVLGQSDLESADVVTAAVDRLRDLAKHIARLTLVLPSPAPADMQVRVDGAPVSQLADRDPVPLQPGSHVVIVTATGVAPFRSEVVLSEGAQASLPVSLTRLAPDTPPDGAARTAGWIAIAAGGALLVTSAVLLLARHDDISTLDRACPGGLCPPDANALALDSTRNHALVEGPVGAAFGIAGIAATGVGAVLVLTSKGTRVVPLLAPDRGGVAVAGVFR
jgi:hypothetical protein